MESLAGFGFGFGFGFDDIREMMEAENGWFPSPDFSFSRA